MKKPTRPRPLPAVDADLVVRDALRTMTAPTRRLFLQRGLTLGGLSLLTGCALDDSASINKLLTKISFLNDRVQAALFDPHALAPTYPESMITRPFPFNAYYGIDEVRHVDGDAFRLEVGGMVADQQDVDAARAARDAADRADHASHLRRRMERDRSMGRRALLRLPRAHRRRHDREVRRLPVRRRLLHEHRHADRAASADAVGADVRRAARCRPSTASR